MGAEKASAAGLDLHASNGEVTAQAGVCSDMPEACPPKAEETDWAGAAALCLAKQLQPGQQPPQELESRLLDMLQELEEAGPLTPRTQAWGEAVCAALEGDAGACALARQHPHLQVDVSRHTDSAEPQPNPCQARLTAAEHGLPALCVSPPPKAPSSHPTKNPISVGVNAGDEQPPPKTCVTFANTTSWNPTTAQWVASQRSICTMVSETHLGPTGQSRAATVLDRLGVRADFASAANTDKGGWAGGLLVAAHRHRNIAWKPGFVHEGCGYLVAMVRLKSWTLTVIGLYLRHSEGLQGATNSIIVANLIAFLQLLKTPWVAGGDWNIEPAAMADTTIPSLLHAGIVAPPEPTIASGGVLDWVLASAPLCGALTICVDWEVPWRPHAAIHVSLPSEAAATPVPQL